MRCTSPRTVGFKSDGKTLAWSPKDHNKQYSNFQLPCGKCIECRLDYARQWAIRCVHESKMHEQNSFITLTYSDEKLNSQKLVYRDFQLFMKKLRFANPNKELSMFVTGEYGEKTKRPHWHGLIFGWSPTDAVYKYSNDRGDKVYESSNLSTLWGNGLCEFGSVTFESAGYCARYAAKKLIHGNDESHEYHPISKKSSKQAIGKRWLEKYWPDVFNYGHIVLPNGKTCSIPRYYEKWFKENKPDEWLHYVTKVKSKKSEFAIQKEKDSIQNYFKTVDKRGPFRTLPLTPNQVQKIITKSKFKLLQENLKL